MAKKAEDKKTEASGQGRAVILPNGERRVDYIRRRYYAEGATRSIIRKELCDMTKEDLPYQIVFAASKEDKEAYTQRLKDKAAADKEAARAAKEAEKVKK